MTGNSLTWINTFCYGRFSVVETIHFSRITQKISHFMTITLLSCGTFHSRTNKRAWNRRSFHPECLIKCVCYHLMVVYLILQQLHKKQNLYTPLGRFFHLTNWELSNLILLGEFIIPLILNVNTLYWVWGAGLDQSIVREREWEGGRWSRRGWHSGFCHRVYFLSTGLLLPVVLPWCCIQKRTSYTSPGSHK